MYSVSPRFVASLVLVLIAYSAGPTHAQEPVERAGKEMVKRSELFLRSLPGDFIFPTDDAGKLLLREYGAVFVSRGGVHPPSKVIFRDETDVRDFQRSVQHAKKRVGGHTVELQTPALRALEAAMLAARALRLKITPRSSDSARRGYDHTVKLWRSRVDPAMIFWTRKGKVSPAEASRIKALSPYEQVPEILKLERKGIFFSKDLSKSIIYSVAPPGTSQHISMLALDINEFDDPRIRSIMAAHGWFQTVISDLPHFTFLGVPATDLPSLGLKEVRNGGRSYWVPDLAPLRLRDQ